jgi:hypothetical protein
MSEVPLEIDLISGSLLGILKLDNNDILLCDNEKAIPILCEDIEMYYRQDSVVVIEEWKLLEDEKVSDKVIVAQKIATLPNNQEKSPDIQENKYYENRYRIINKSGILNFNSCDIFLVEVKSDEGVKFIIKVGKTEDYFTWKIQDFLSFSDSDPFKVRNFTTFFSNYRNKLLFNF